MVASRIVDMDENLEADIMEDLPEMMFAEGEEPVGVRVLTYQSSRAIKKILKGLDEAELLAIRSSSFGKIIEIGEKPSFSGRFARYLMSRQLKVKKKHEVWFRFAGQPVRFSLREFAIVTGLPCGQYPPKSKMKMKETIAERPYWPSLFGKVEVVTISSVIKMLRRITVTDREIRIKYACLAILSSVLLPTSLNMKISREHVEAIKDLEEFYSYPWGRLAYAMLMSCIKERDEINLSQNTIAIKGFALALPLVVVEAVPALTEVYQETCSSSESDSGDDNEEGPERTSKKQTLSPAHARSIDKKPEVYVNSIIDEDPARPLDEKTLVWLDESDDPRVDNLVKLIKDGHKFTASMFKGGVTKTDVQRMRDEGKPHNKEKKSRKVTRKIQEEDETQSETTSGLISVMKTDIMRIDGNVYSTMREVNNVSCKLSELEGSMKRELVGWIGKIKEEIKGQIVLAMKDQVGKTNLNPAVARGIPSGTKTEDGRQAVDDEFYQTTIENVIGSIEDYTTPPRHISHNQGNGGDVNQDAPTETGVNLVPRPERRCLSASSQTHINHSGHTMVKVSNNGNKDKSPEALSFSLGLTQKDNSPTKEQLEEDDNGPDLNVADAECADNVEENKICRKSKRQKIFPSNLMADYECGHDMVSVGRRSARLLFMGEEWEVTKTKFGLLGERLQKTFVLNVAGLAAINKEIKDIAERSRPMSAKVVDLVTRLIKRIQQNQENNEVSKRDEFFDTKFAASVTRNYSKFSKCEEKEGHVFPKGTIEFMSNIKDSICMIHRFYMPFNFDKRHWVGVCVDCDSWKIYVLDCNTKIKSDKEIVKELAPIAEVFPYLLKKACGATYEESLDPMMIERPKGICQTIDVGLSGMTALVLMWNHSIGGMDSCRSVNADHVAMEAKGAAVMAYEFKEMLC